MFIPLCTIALAAVRIVITEDNLKRLSLVDAELSVRIKVNGKIKADVATIISSVSAALSISYDFWDL